MATTTVSGLVSGLDTSTIVSQLIAVERNSQTLLKTRLTTEQSNVKTLQDLNAKLASLATSAEKLGKATAWNPVTVTSSSDQVTATGTAGATTGAIGFTVNQVAAAHAVAFTGTAAMGDVVVGGDPGKVQVTLGDGTVKEIDAGGGTLSELVSGINAAGTGLKAGVVRLDDGSYRLRVTSAATGADGAFTLTASDGGAVLGGATVLTQGRDASITVGTDTVTSASNTFSGVLSGLDVTLKAGIEPGTAVDLTVEQDTASMVTSVKELVDSVNSLLTAMDAATKYASTATSSSTGSTSTYKTGTLAGDAQVRAVRSQLLETVYPGDGTSLASLGIQTDRYGKLVLDEAALTKAIGEDPAKVAAAFTAGTAGTTGTTGTAGTAGFAERVRAVAKGASDSVSGTITGAINGRTSTIDRLQDSIDAWDLRLETREATLTRQFTAMETALSTLNSQSSWLASQISSLSTSSDS